MADYPTGDWYRKYLMSYDDKLLKQFEDMAKQKDITLEIQNIQNRIENIIDALQNAIEKGNDLHLGIVVGQTLSQLKDIARR